MEKMQWEHEDYTTARDANDRAYWLANVLIKLGGLMVNQGEDEDPECWGWMVNTIARHIAEECGAAGAAISGSD